eukprot:479490-Amphidinium_carterae.1
MEKSLSSPLAFFAQHVRMSPPLLGPKDGHGVCMALCMAPKNKSSTLRGQVSCAVHGINLTSKTILQTLFGNTT